jgi:hypothetical protein
MQIIAKIKPYTESLHIKLSDIKFDSKKWIENAENA